MQNNRETYTKKMMELKKDFEQHPLDKNIAFDYAEKLFQLGDFAQAQDILKSLTDMSNAMYLNAQIEYMNGNYQKAEELYATLQSSEFKREAEQGLELVYYQTGQYSKAKSLPSPSSIGEMMMAFGGRRPYAIEWSGAENAIIPFIEPEPLPLIQIKIRGEMYNFIIDSGAGDTILDVDLSAKLGVKSITTLTGVGAGDMSATANYGILDEIVLGNMKISTVPVTIMPTAPFSAVYNNEVEIHGVMGVGVFRQFFSIMDYPAGQLVLYPKDKKVTLKNAKEIPFALASSHLIIAKGEANGREINVFMDSGLAVPGVGILLSNDTIGYTNTDVSEPESVEGVGAGGVTEFQISEFTVDTFKLGILQEVKDLYGLLGIFPESMYFNEKGGFFIDTLVSHEFLKRYKWAIDFDSMKMIFA
jgi:hypothetical protein